MQNLNLHNRRNGAFNTVKIMELSPREEGDNILSKKAQERLRETLNTLKEYFGDNIKISETSNTVSVEIVGVKTITFTKLGDKFPVDHGEISKPLEEAVEVSVREAMKGLYD